MDFKKVKISVKDQASVEVSKPFLFSECDHEQAEFVPLGQADVAVYSRTSPDKETPNEDCAAVVPIGKNRAVLAVADGAGGYRSGAKASKIAVETLLHILSKRQNDEVDLRPLIIDAFEVANSQISALGIGAATTFTVAEVNQNTVRPYHVGDSFLMVTGGKGKIKHCSTAHSPVGYAVAAGYIDRKEALASEEKHYVSNLLGLDRMHIEIGSPIELAKRDTIIVSSDGLTDNMFVKNIVNQIKSGDVVSSVSELAATCRKNMVSTSKKDRLPHADDLTVLIYRSKESR